MSSLIDSICLPPYGVKYHDNVVVMFANVSAVSENSRIALLYYFDGRFRRNVFEEMSQRGKWRGSIFEEMAQKYV